MHKDGKGTAAVSATPRVPKTQTRLVRAPPDAPLAASRLPCVLIIDPDQDFASRLAAAREDLPMEVHHARTLHSGLQRLVELRPVIVLVDASSSVSWVREAVRLGRAQHPKVPIVALIKEFDPERVNKNETSEERNY